MRAFAGVTLLFMLFLAAVPVAVQAKEWKSGELVSRETFKYGAFEARMKAAAGSGAISGFLTIVPDAGSTRPWQEMAFEFFGKSFGKNYQTQIIVPGPGEADIGNLPRSQNMMQHTSPTSFVDEFHTVRMEWTPSRLSFYYDGTKVREETDSSKYAQLLDSSKALPMEIRLTLWAGEKYFCKFSTKICLLIYYHD